MIFDYLCVRCSEFGPMKAMYIISGCNGSGKTTTSYSLLPELLECRQFVNSDEFAKSLSPFNPSAASVRASRYMLMKVNYLLQREETFSIETTLATRSLLNIVARAQEHGYRVVILYLWLSSPQMAIERVRRRVSSGGHDIPDEVIKRRYYMGLSYLFNHYIPVCDQWILADNTTAPFKVIAQGAKGEEPVIRNQKTYEIIKTITLSAKKLSDENSKVSDQEAQDI